MAPASSSLGVAYRKSMSEIGYLRVRHFQDVKHGSEQILSPFGLFFQRDVCDTVEQTRRIVGFTLLVRNILVVSTKIGRVF